MLKIYQVYYEDSQLGLCDFTPVKNENCTEFFENSVIAELVSAEKEADYIGVVSWNLRGKLISPIGPTGYGFMFNENDIYNVIDRKGVADVFGFIRYNNHNPLTYFCGVHPKLENFTLKILSELGRGIIPTTLDHVFYGNHFVAKREVYQSYVSELLIPAMEIMKTMPELWQDSGYPKPLPKHLSEKWGVSFYPYHAFICERLFSYWCHVKNLNVKYF